MTEQFLDVNGVRLCVETFGRSDDPAILLIHGASASMLWWEAGLCEQLAASGRFVIRYDQRDTGRSTTYPVGEPAYDLVDLAGDALAILDRLGIQQAHVVGCSMFGALVLLLGVDHPERVASLTFVSTSTCEPGLPPIGGHGPDQPTDLSDPAVQVEYVLDVLRAYDGVSPFFDEATARALVEADVARAADMAASLTNPFLIEMSGPVRGSFGDIAAPTLVVHGERDPVFPLPHGEALARAVPGAELVVLADAAHDLPRQRWDDFVTALVRHTAGAGR
jgi:pimeloyl-ACP methyl ester carboxylesterase